MSFRRHAPRPMKVWGGPGACKHPDTETVSYNSRPAIRCKTCYRIESATRR